MEAREATLCYTTFACTKRTRSFSIFIDGHVTQELACVMAAISMAPNVLVKCYDVADTEPKWR